MVEAFGDDDDLAMGVDQVESAKGPREDADADAEFIDNGEREFHLLEKEDHIVLVGPGLVGKHEGNYDTVSYAIALLVLLELTRIQNIPCRDHGEDGEGKIAGGREVMVGIVQEDSDESLR